MTAVGGVLATRAAANRPLGQIARYLLGRDGIAVRKTIFVERPVDQVFALWRHLENFPRFMQHVRSVAIDKRDPMRALWSVDGPFGAPLDLETVTTRIIDGREIAWQTTADQAIQHRGSVRFVPTNGGTRVHLELTYRPPGGAFTHAVAHLLGWDPKARIDHDMVRMKGLLEHGHTRAHGAVVSEAALVH
jgi:uncharacterized membrane protein